MPQLCPEIKFLKTAELLFLQSFTSRKHKKSSETSELFWFTKQPGCYLDFFFEVVLAAVLTGVFLTREEVLQEETFFAALFKVAKEDQVAETIVVEYPPETTAQTWV